MAEPNEIRFANVLGADLRLPGNTGRIRRFAAGEVIFSAGDAGNGFYVIETGRVQLSAVVANGETRVLAVCGPGDFFG